MVTLVPLAEPLKLDGLAEPALVTVTSHALAELVPPSPLVTLTTTTRRAVVGGCVGRGVFVGFGVTFGVDCGVEPGRGVPVTGTCVAGGGSVASVLGCGGRVMSPPV